MPWARPGLCCGGGGDEESRSCRKPPAGRPVGGRSGLGGSSLEGPCLQEGVHPGETMN